MELSDLRTLRASSLDSLITEGRPIYVLNTSRTPSGDKGVIVVNFFDGNRREFFKVPPTFIPLAVTDAIPPQSIKASKDFRQTLVKGMLTLVHPDDAEAYLTSDEATEEYDAIMLSEMSVRKNQVNLEQEVAKRSKVVHSTTESGGPIEDVGAQADVVTPKIRGLMEELQGNQVSEKEALQTLRRHATAVSEADISFVLSRTADYPSVHKWAKSTLTKTGAVTVKAKTATAQVKKGAPARSTVKITKKDDASFDFDTTGGEDMTAAERAADAKARSRAMSDQALDGKSKYAEVVLKS
jgi:hypothetical protein